MMYPFSAQYQCTLDATGFGQVRFGPAGESWEITSLTVAASSKIKNARCRVYDGFVGDQYLVVGTFSGSSGDTSDTPMIVNDGTSVWVVWENGDAGATATVTIRGRRTVAGNGFRARG